MKNIVIKLDFLSGPIWKDTYDPIRQRECTGVSAIDNDAVISRLETKIQDLYNSYYEFDSHGKPCWFNLEKEKADKEKMLGLLSNL